MNPINLLTKTFKKNFPTFVINSILDLESYYVVSLTRPVLKKDEFMLDGLYAVDKKTYHIKPFSVSMDSKRYGKALENPLYIKSK